MVDRAHLLAALAVRNDIRFLDLPPVFQEEVGTGADLYYPFNTHWNQPGHDLVAGSIHSWVEEVLQDPSSEISGHQ